MSEECQKPQPPLLLKSIAIHLPFVLQYASNLYRSAFGAPTLWGKGNTVSTPPICIAVRLPFVLQYASHLYRNIFAKILVVVVTGMFPNTILMVSLLCGRLTERGFRLLLSSAIFQISQLRCDQCLVAIALVRFGRLSSVHSSRAFSLAKRTVENSGRGETYKCVG